MKKYDILHIGIQVIDFSVYGINKQVVERDATTATNIKMTLGGDALNQSITTSALGAKVALMGAVGNDTLGEVLLKTLSEYPIDIYDKQLTCGTSSSVLLIHKDTGDRNIIYNPGQNALLSVEDMDFDIVKDAKIVSIGSAMCQKSLDGKGMIKTLETAKESGAITAIDFAVAHTDISKEDLYSLLALSDYVLPSEVEAAWLCGESSDPALMADKIREMGAFNCIIKLGDKGSYICTDNVKTIVPPYPCKPINTTGAGDTFVGAFLYGLSMNWDVVECAKFGNAAGAIAVENDGANGFIKNVEQVRERMSYV